MRTAWGWSRPRARARLQRSAAQGLARRESPAKSVTASRSCLSQAQRKLTARILPDWRVEGAAPGEGGPQGLGGGGSGGGSCHPGEQAGGADGAGAGQRGEDVRGVQGEFVGDLPGQGLDLLGEGGQDGEQGGGDVCLCGAVVAGGAAGRGGQAGVQDGGGLGAGRRSRSWPARLPGAGARASRRGPGWGSGPGSAG